MDREIESWYVVIKTFIKIRLPVEIEVLKFLLKAGKQEVFVLY
jgi:hypothetical protein